MSKKLHLIQINKSHLATLFEWRNEASFINNLTNRNRLVSLSEFDLELQDDFKRDRHIQFLIIKGKDKIGTIYSYSYNLSDKYCFISVYIKPQEAQLSYGIKAFSIFSQFLFLNFNLYKVYFDVYEYNKKMISVLDKCNFSIEGTFKNQHLVKDIRYDVLRFAFYREDSIKWASKLKTTTANILYK